MYKTIILSLISILLINQGFSQSLEKSNSHLEKGNIFFAQKAYEKAIDGFNNSISFDKRCSECYYQRGRANANLNNLEAAIIDFTLSLKFNSNDYHDIYKITSGH